MWDHLLLHCEVAYALWSIFFSPFRLSWIMSVRVTYLYACWWLVVALKRVVVWNIVPSCLLWCLWRKQNNRSFEDCERNLASLCIYFLILFIFGQLSF
jgi:hypothetical protein